MKRFSQSFWRVAAAPRQALVAHWDNLPPSLRASTAWTLLVFGLASLLLFTASCAHTLQGLEREQALYQTGTNIVGQVQGVVPYLPAPVGNTVEIVLALATSALGAWNLHQQAALKQLKNGKGSGNGNGKPSPGPAPPAAIAANSLAQPTGTLP